MPHADLLSPPEPGSAQPGAAQPGLGSARPDLRRPDLGWRVLVSLVALVVSLTAAPTYVVGLLTAAALVLAVERLARSRGRGGADAALVLTGGVAVVLVLVGLVMGSTPIGLSRTTWGAGLSLVSLLALGVAVLLRRPDPVARGAWLAGLRSAPWAVAVISVAAIAIGISVRSVGPAERAPVQMSFGQVQGSRVQVVVSASQATGPLELRTTQGGDDISYPLFRVGAGQRRTTTLALPTSGRFVVSLNYPDQSQPLRSLVLDR